MEKQFIENSQLIIYSQESFSQATAKEEDFSTIDLTDNKIYWLNTYGNQYYNDFKRIIKQKHLDAFLLKLIQDSNHPNKVVELDDALFITIKILKSEELKFTAEQLAIIVSHNFVWTIQKKHGDYFQWIRDRLKSDVGIVRKEKADYLLYLLLESMVDNYSARLKKYVVFNDERLDFSSIKPTPEFAVNIEEIKQNLFQLKRSSNSLRETIMKIEKSPMKGIRGKFFSELKEQTSNLISEIDSEILELESKVNLIFNIQGHRLNEVMKTLTIFSVIFIPLTFLAGIYGMNFEYMPELGSRYGYYILLGIMLLVAVIIIIYFRVKRWF